ncbi:hypothetical protein [Jonesia quinghaiensis]|uniref:hypothetical protein n=1 Tax=Jonesia quinghaiensis TaxID=262806 RepID=UPI0012FAA395
MFTIVTTITAAVVSEEEDAAATDDTTVCESNTAVGASSVSGKPTWHSGSQLTDEHINNARTIVQVSEEMDVPEFGRIIAIATAMQESTLVNIKGGDRDSLGLFQQRPSMEWGTPEQIMDPKYASNKFYDALVKVSGWQSMKLTVAVQAAQRSGLPDEYAKHEKSAPATYTHITGSTAADRCGTKSHLPERVFHEV